LKKTHSVLKKTQSVLKKTHSVLNKIHMCFYKKLYYYKYLINVRRFIAHFMKQYITTNFNLENCCKAGLNTIDVSILDWILTFSRSGKMQTLKAEGKIWFWINLKAIIEDYTVDGYNFLGINTPDAMSRRIAKMEGLGLLYRKIINSYTDKTGVERKGNYLFVSVNYDKVMYITGNVINKCIGNMQDYHTDINPEGCGIKSGDGAGCKVGTNITKLYNHKAISSSSNPLVTDKINKNISTNNTADESDTWELQAQDIKRLDKQVSHVDEDDIYHDEQELLRLQKQNDKDTEVQDIGKEVSSQSQATDNGLDLSLLRTGIYTKLTKIFNASPKIVFDNFDIVSGIITTCLSLNVTDIKAIENYMDYAYKTVNDRQDIKFKNKYFGKVVCTTDFALEYFNNHKTEEPKVYTKVCPVCGKVHSIADPECPECHIVHDSNTAEVELYKKIYALPKQERLALEKELEAVAASFGLSFNIPKYKMLKAEVYKRYGIDNKGL